MAAPDHGEPSSNDDSPLDNNVRSTFRRIVRKLAQEKFELESSEETQTIYSQILADLRPLAARGFLTSASRTSRSVRTRSLRDVERNAISGLLADYTLVRLLGIGQLQRTRLAVDIASIIDLDSGGVASAGLARAERRRTLAAGPLRGDAASITSSAMAYAPFVLLRASEIENT